MASKKNSRSSTVVGEPKNAWTTGKKSQIYDCNGILEKNACIWRISGVFPFSLKRTIGTRKYAVNKFYAVYGSLVCFASIASCIYGLTVYTISKKSTPSISITTVMIQSVASLLCLTFASVWRIYRRKEISDIVDTMVRQDLVLEKMNCCLHYESNSKIISAYVWTMWTSVVVLMVYDFYASSWFFNHITVIIEWLLWVIPLTAQILDLTIFVSLVGLLGSKFRALNEKISLVVTRANESSPKIIVTSDVCAENLRRIAKAHYNICELSKRINSFFNIAVIINVITAFVILSTTLYYIFVEVQREGKTNYVRVGTYIHWEIIHSVPIIIIVAVCNWTSHQSVNTGKLIHEILVEKIDSRLYETVKTFSLQLHHQKLQFNAAGLFPLNSTLIQSMVGNITTYLVILIQFQPNLDF